MADCLAQSGIYQIRNSITGTRYIGQSGNVDRRLDEHHRKLARNSHSNNHLQASWNKHGPEAFVFEPLAIIEPALLTLFEQRAFDISNSKHGCYNQGPFMDSAMRGTSHRVSLETRIKLRVASTGRRHSSETRRRMSAWQKGRKRGPHTENTRAQISAALKGHAVSQKTREKLSMKQKNNVVSPETRAKISNALKGRTKSKKVRANMSMAQRDHIVSLETRAKISATKKLRLLPKQAKVT